MLRIITILFCWLMASLAVTSVYAQRTGNPVKDAELADKMATKRGNVLKIADNAPDRYVVQKGDTLWDLASKYLTDPWRWPELWRNNKDQIKDPHWIYPGDVLILDRNAGTLTRQRGGVVMGGDPKDVKLSPTQRSSEVAKPIPMLPANVVEPFLTRPLVLDVKVVDGKVQDGEALRNAPEIIGSPDERYILSTGDRVYIRGLSSDAVDWNVFRQGEPLIDPDNGEVLGREAVFLGAARITRRGDPAEAILRNVKKEVLRGDRLLAAERQPIANYLLSRPSKEVKGRVVSIFGGVNSAGQYSIITINRGSAAGLEAGSVLALYRQIPAFVRKIEGQEEPEKLVAPPERFGLITVFKTTEKLSYAIVMEANRPISVGDHLGTP